MKSKKRIFDVINSFFTLLPAFNAKAISYFYGKNYTPSSIFSWKRTMSKKKKKIILTEIFFYLFSIKRNDFTKCIVKNCVLPLQLVEMCPYLFSISQWSRNKSICAAGSWPTVWKNEKITLNDFFSSNQVFSSFFSDTFLSRNFWQK